MENAVFNIQTEPAPMSEAEFLGELHYFRAQQILSAMLERGLIS